MSMKYVAIGLPVAAALLALIFNKAIKDERKKEVEGALILTLREKCILISCAFAMVLALTFLIMDPAHNPWIETNFLGPAVFSVITGASRDDPPVLLDIMTWSWRMRIAGGLIAILFVIGIFADSCRRPKYLLLNLVNSTCFLVLSVYAVILFFLLRNKVLIPIFGIIYFLLELALVCIFGIVAVLLPFTLLFPNTSKVVADTMDSMVRSRPSDAAIDRSMRRMEAGVRAGQALAGALNSLPDTIYDHSGKAFRVSYRNYDSVGYESADGERAVLRSNDDIKQYHW